MPNVNKVMLGDTPLIDLSTDTLETSDQVLTGLQATNKYGEKIIGTGVWSEEDAPAYDYPIGGSYVGSDGSVQYPTCTGFHVYSNATKVRPYAFRGRRRLQSVDVSMADEIGVYAFQLCTALTSIAVKNGVLIKSPPGGYKFASFNNHLYWSDGPNIYISDATSGTPTKTLICTLSSSVPTYTYVDGPYTITFTRSGSTDDFTVTWTQSDEESNLNVNKVCVGDNTLIDVSVDDVTDTNNVYEGVIFHKQDGSVATGTGGSSYYEYSIGGSIIDGTATGYKISSDVTSLGESCFYGCSSLTSTGLENSSVTSLGKQCFQRCTSLTSTGLTDRITSLGYSCFEGCTSLTSTGLTDSVTSIGDYCFCVCASLTSAGLENSSVTSLGSGCFQECTSLTSTGLENSSVTSLGIGCFYGCSSLTSTGLENSSVTSLGIQCFYGCSSLTNEVMPSTLTSMGYNCFYFCSNLESIDCSSVNTMGYACFGNCNKLSNIIVKNGVKITPTSGQVKIATINGKMYWQQGTSSNKIYVADPAVTSPTTVIGTLTSSSPTFTYDDGAGYSVTFTRVDSSNNFTITWTTSNEGDENNG